MTLDVTASASGPGLAFSLVWNAQGPVGGDTWPFPKGMDGRTDCNMTVLALTARGFRLLSLPPGAGCAARAVYIASGPACALTPGTQQRLQVSQSLDGFVNVSCGGVAVVVGAFVLPSGGASTLGGRTGIYASVGSAVNVSSYVVSDGWLAAPSSLPVLAVDAMSGAGNFALGWRVDSAPGLWRFGDGIVCDAEAACEHAAKWNFVGEGVTLWAPRGLAGAGNVSVSVDGGPISWVNLNTTELLPSAAVWTSSVLLPGRHALTVRAAPGTTLPVDSIDVIASASG